MGGYGKNIPRDFRTRIWPAVDLGKLDKLTYTEFLAATMDYQGFSKSQLYIAGVFRLLDANHTSYVNVENLMEIFPEHSQEELNQMINEVAPAGRLNFQEFEKLM